MALPNRSTVFKYEVQLSVPVSTGRLYEERWEPNPF